MRHRLNYMEQGRQAYKDICVKAELLANDIGRMYQYVEVLTAAEKRNLYNAIELVEELNKVLKGFIPVK